MDHLNANLISGSSVTFEDEPIGSGCEKVVFFTEDRNGAICFFREGLSDRAERRRRLEKILTSFNPTINNPAADYWRNHFCWPLEIIDGGGGLGGFLNRHRLLSPALAVVVPVYRSNFFFTQLCTGKKVEKEGKWFTGIKARAFVPPEEQGNFLTRLQVCTKMARAVRRLHFAGLAHSDLSNRNVLIDPRGGDACIIDIDSLVVPDVAPPAVIGTPGYIAPEVLMGGALPSIGTDRYALAVLIYETLLARHPLWRENSLCSDPEEDERLQMGSKAVFVEHPADTSNWPRRPFDIPVDRLGPFLKRLFIKTFVDGLHSPPKRADANEWEVALYDTLDLLHPTPGGREWFVLAPGMPLKCPHTGSRLSDPVPIAQFYRQQSPGNFLHEKRTLTIYHNLQLFNWHVFCDTLPNENADRRRKGYFAFDEGRWVLVNESGAPMQVVHGRSIHHGEGLEVKSGMKLKLSTLPNGRLLYFDFLNPQN